MAASGDKYRSFLHGEGEKNTRWRFGSPPNYDIVNKLFEEGRTKVWAAGSLEEKVQNLLKTWEMEVFHKVCFDDYKSIDPNNYTFSLNGMKPVTLEEKKKLGGGYNTFLRTSLPAKFRAYDSDKETVDSAHVAFTTAFPRGFAIEVLQVYSGPPVIVYKFRHWGYMEGPFKGYAPTGELVEIFGMSIFQVDENMKVVKVEIFMDAGELLGGLMKGGGLDGSINDAASTCPFLTGTG
ncbi:pathogen-related protein-like [Euphorbia lathyris]|uniref:pathogen-related protein-like n=1 Tax=Euphorbia lathyris TaxID=212925 RepID=UPI0033136238